MASPAGGIARTRRSGRHRRQAEEFAPIDQFARFYAEVMAVKAVAAEPLADASDSFKQSRYNTIVSTLVAALERQSMEFAERGGEYGRRLFARGLYVMAAFADDLLLSFAWWGRDQWVANPLESRLFGTRVAGETLFDDIDNDLQDYEIGRRDLAKVYLAALLLGFQGRYREREGEDVLAEYRRRLYVLAYGHEASVDEAAEVLIGDAYERTQTGGVPQRMPYLRPLLYIGAGILGVYILISHAIWAYHTFDLAQVVRAVRFQISG